jgi:two-component system chemotaxis sensor kinase CheA
MMIDDEELRKLYEISSQDRLQKLKTGLLHLQQHSDDAIFNELRRDLHSFKGDSKSVGVQAVASLIQPIEKIIVSVQTQGLTLTADVSDRLLQGVDALDRLVQEAVTGQPCEVEVAHVVDQLSAIATTLERPEESLPSIVPLSPTTPLTSSFIDDVELRQLYALSSQDHCQKLKAELAQLEPYPSDHPIWDILRREIHSLKGDSRSVEAEDIEILAQQIETVLKRLQSGQIAFSVEIRDRLSQGIYAIEQLVQEAVTGQPSSLDVTHILDQLVELAEPLSYSVLNLVSPDLASPPADAAESVLPDLVATGLVITDLEPTHLELTDLSSVVEYSAQPTPAVAAAPESTESRSALLIEDEELRDLYQLSSQDRLQKLKVGFFQLTETPFDETILAELKQDAHSLKGDSRAVGVEAIAALIQQIEAIIAAIQTQQIQFTPFVSDRIYQGLDGIEHLIQSAVTGVSHPVDVARLLNELTHVLDAEEATQAAFAQPDGYFALLPPNYIKDRELREIYRVSSQERLQKLEAGLLRLEKHPNDETILEELLRTAHSLKGDARSVGGEPVEMLTHQIEEILEHCKQKQIIVTPDVGDRLYQGLDAIAKLIQETVTGQPSGVELAAVFQSLLDVIPTPAEQDFTPVPVELVVASTPGTSAIAIPELTPATSAVATPELLLSNVEESYRIDVVRVQTRHLDSLITQVEELTVAKTNFAHIAYEIEEMADLWKEWKTLRNQTSSHHTAIARANPYQDRLDRIISSLRIATQENSAQLEKITEEMRERIRTLRLLPLSAVFQLFPRMVRDLAKQQAKEVELVIEGGEITADKSILEELKDPLIHIIRNAIDHGIEIPDERARLGKPPVAKIKLKGYQTVNNIFIEVTDDGRGLDLDRICQTAIKRGLYTTDELSSMSANQLQNLIFVPGFSTRTFITEISGRGIGLDVVRTNIERLKGDIQVESISSQGCTFRIRLSTTLTTINALLLNVQGVVHALPIEFLDTTLMVAQDQILVRGDRAFIDLDGQDIPVADLGELLTLTNSRAYDPTWNVTLPKEHLQPCIILNVGEERAGFFVDRLLNTQEVVMKSQSQILKRVRNVAGATILPTGDVCTILNASDLIKSLQEHALSNILIKSRETIRRKPTILLVEDSAPVRTQEKRLLEKAGYEVEIAVDGLEGYNKLKTRSFDAVLSDVEMPNLDGLSLTTRIRQHEEYKNLPIILVTTLDSDEDKIRGAEAGASAYIIKSRFNQDILLEILGRLVNF